MADNENNKINIHDSQDVVVQSNDISSIVKELGANRQEIEAAITAVCEKIKKDLREKDKTGQNGKQF